MNIAVFVSGNGSNLQAIIDAVDRGELHANVSVVVSDNKNAYALERAKKAGIDTLVLDPARYPTREEYDAVIREDCQRRGIDLIVMAGYMRIVSPQLVAAFRNRIVNIHPSLLPAFKGVHGIKDAFEYGVKHTGVTVHFVDELLDHGPVVFQEVVTVEDTDTRESLEKKIHEVEHRLYPEAIRLFGEGKLIVDGRRVRVHQ